jgi:hypothetical protein
VRFCHLKAGSRQPVAFPARRGFESVYNLAGGVEAGSTGIDREMPRD